MWWDLLYSYSDVVYLGKFASIVSCYDSLSLANHRYEHVAILWMCRYFINLSLYSSISRLRYLSLVVSISRYFHLSLGISHYSTISLFHHSNTPLFTLSLLSPLILLYLSIEYFHFSIVTITEILLSSNSFSIPGLRLYTFLLLRCGSFNITLFNGDSSTNSVLVILLDCKFTCLFI